jgi:hypothetical protein
LDSMISVKRRRCMLWLIAPVLLALLTACGPTRVVVEGDFPAPLIEPLPITLGIWMGEDFSQHEFFEQAKSKKESSWIVNTGDAQVKMWNTLWAGMFRDVVYMKGEPGPGQMNQVVDGVLIPHVEELQYTIPAQTNVKVYEIWMRYRFELVTSSGEPIGEWTMIGYGKTPTALLQSNQQAVNLAAVMALRDAGANFATSFTQVPVLQEWLQQRGTQATEEAP